MTLLDPLIAIYQYSLQPVAPFTWFGLNVSAFDLVATVRLCVILRQIKDSLYQEHIKKHGHSAAVEDRSFARSLSTTLTVVYGGEAVLAPMIGVPPSFMVSGVFPALYAAVQGFVDALPWVPAMSLKTELPLSIVDGFTRAFLLCSAIPVAITTNASPTISSSPWTLLVSSFVIANGGFFFTNLFSFLNPTPLALQTPPELQAYGWTTADLWAAPAITALYATLTHAQPFWAELHALLAGSSLNEKLLAPPLDDESARALCAAILACLFTGRTWKNFSGQETVQKKEPKTKTQ